MKKWWKINIQPQNVTFMIYETNLKNHNNSNNNKCKHSHLYESAEYYPSGLRIMG